ncbi:MAG: hypothetical protein ACOYNS_13975 [Bacteroidota bacterium]
MESKTIEVVADVCADPRCTPPDDPVMNVAVDAVVLVPLGIVPVALTATEPQHEAPVPAAKALVQFAISEKPSE